MAKRDTAQRAFLLLLVVAVSAAFLWMIRAFLIPLLLAATFASLAYPLQERLEGRLRGRKGVAASLTLLAVLFVVALPLAAFAAMLAAEAVRVAAVAGPWLQQAFAERGELLDRLRNLPGYGLLRPHASELLSRAGSLGAALGALVFARLSSITAGTLGAVLDLVIILYAMFFFLVGGRDMLRRVLYLAPLSHEDELQLLTRFRSMARATIKGTLVIGLVQGAATGLALWAAGVPSALLWGSVTVFASLIPAVGTALVWGPAVVWLLVSGSALKAGLVAVWCAVAVGGVDNVLRPALVGKDTQVHELLVLLSTLGGLSLFGVPGLLLGPVLAVLFLTVWDLYGAAFKEYLPGVGKL